mmetsp:Transcript_40259/g.88005  ORF Transcript_40259/g.88005 Transcript_40259/m.88005 type:complete len:249 (+) Transcript_40259:2791-3537(+)
MLDHLVVHRGCNVLVEEVLQKSRLLRCLCQARLDVDAVVSEVLRVRPRCGIPHLQLGVFDHAALLEVHEKHLARTEPSLVRDLLVRNVYHSNLRCQDETLVGGNVESARTKPIPIQCGTELKAIREGHQSWTIPGFHEARLVLVEGALLRLHVFRILPSLRDHHHDDLCQVAVAAGQEQLYDVVEESRVAANVLVNREEHLQVQVTEALSVMHECLTSLDLVAIALKSVDLAVVRNASEWVRTIPGRK